jgi:hypothetical protein
MKPPVKSSRKGARGDSAATERAEALAIAALTFLAGDPDRLGNFLALSGLGPDSLRSAAQEPQFLLGVLDHVVSDERLLLDFAEHEAVDPFDVTRARQALEGPYRDMS